MYWPVCVVSHKHGNGIASTFISKIKPKGISHIQQILGDAHVAFFFCSSHSESVLFNLSDQILTIYGITRGQGTRLGTRLT